MFENVGRQVFWFVPLWVTGAVFMVVQSKALMFVMPIVAIIAITPYRTGRLSAVEAMPLFVGGSFAAAGVGLVIKLIVGN